MKDYNRPSVIKALVFFAFLPLQQEAKKVVRSDIQLLFVGTFHGDDVSAKSGEKWFGLFQKKNQQELRQVTVSVKKAHDVISDENNSDSTGKEVTVSTRSKPLFLVRGSNLFCERIVETVFWGRQSLVDVRRSSFVMQDSTRYVLLTQGKLKNNYGPYIEQFKLVLRAKGVSQTIATLPRTDTDGSPTLMWAGDFDGDGKLDLLVNLTNHYNVSLPTLFLSSEAKDDELVRKVASLRTVGC